MGRRNPLREAAALLPVDPVLQGAGRLRAEWLGPSIARLARGQRNGVVPFVVLTSPRSGSNLFMSLLGDHPRVAVAGEVLSTDVALSDSCPSAPPSARLRPVRLLHEHVFGRDEVDAAGCKLFYHHGAGFSRSAWVYLAALPDLRVVELRRRDRLAQYVSFLRAMDSGVWLRRDGDAPGAGHPIDVDVDGFRAHVERWEARRRDALERLGSRTLRIVWYEDLVADRAGTMDSAFAFLGVGPATVRSPLQRQRQRALSEIVVDHDRVVDAVEPWRWEPDDRD